MYMYVCMCVCARLMLVKVTYSAHETGCCPHVVSQMDGDHFVPVSVIAGFSKVRLCYGTWYTLCICSVTCDSHVTIVTYVHAGQKVNYRSQPDNGGYQRYSIHSMVPVICPHVLLCTIQHTPTNTHKFIITHVFGVGYPPKPGFGE